MPPRESKLLVASDTAKIEANLIYQMFEMLKMPSKTNSDSTRSISTHDAVFQEWVCVIHIPIP